uniref:Ribonuclease P/MRP subunit p14 n=1 Tax=Ornithorhynchus anatinus TaxID=9258 RepID=A0A6I8P700_ORNAN
MKSQVLPGTVFERIVYKNPSKYHYMKVQLEFRDSGARLNAAQFKQLIISSLKGVFGEVGAALPLDILTYEAKALLAILRVSSRYEMCYSFHRCRVNDSSYQTMPQRASWFGGHSTELRIT